MINSDDATAGSLRDAIADVDPGGEIVFDSATADPSLADQILIDKDVTITGLGAGTTRITGASNDRVFQLAGAFTVTIRDLEITDGNAPDGTTGPAGSGNGNPGASGGAILSTFSTSSLTLRRTLIDGNSAGAGGSGADGDGGSDCGSGADGGSGGAISTAGTLMVEDSEISGNDAGDGGGGGGFCTQGGDGAPGGDGGGINALGIVTISDTTISGNFAGDGGPGTTGSTPGDGGDGGDGGGLRYGGGDVPTLTNVTIAGNEAGAGGLIGPGGAAGATGGVGGSGGGLSTTAPATVTNATIAGNTAGTGAPGTLTPGPPPNTSPPVHGTGGGVAGAATLNNTILSSNNAPAAGRNCSVAVLDGGFNISFPNVAEQGCVGGYATGDPILGSLAPNGGATPTMAITAASSAFDHVPASGADCPAADQRDVARPQFTNCDAGAFELEPTAPVTGGGTPTITPAPTGERAAALKKCKKKRAKLDWPKKRYNKCKKQANLLPV